MSQISTFIIRMVVIWILGFMVLIFFPAIELAAQEATASSLAAVLGALGMQAESSGTQLAAGAVRIIIIPECTSLLATLLLVSAVLSFPASIGSRLLAVAVGSICLWIFNLLRLLVLLGILSYDRGWFSFFHLYLWQALSLAVVWSMFFCWARRATRAPS